MDPLCMNICALQGLGCQEIQFTLVDCPGHASLIRTILGGAHIIDMMLLVVDVTKGIQVRISSFAVLSCGSCALSSAWWADDQNVAICSFVEIGSQ